MISVRFHSLRDVTRKLFLETGFDFFRLTEASFVCAASFSVDGHCNPDFYSGDDETKMENETYVSWESLRPICFRIIQGKRTPSSFRLVFFLSAQQAASFFHVPELSQNADIEGYLLILHYKNQELTATTGTSFFRFSFDKESERLWDRNILSWFDGQTLNYSELY